MAAKKPPQKKKTYWFTARKYGWGWAPATPEGWAVIGTYVVVNVINFFRIQGQTQTMAETLSSWVPETFIISFFLIYICLKKGENPNKR